MDTMRAVRYHAGRTGVSLDEVPVPLPGPGEVRLRVEAAGLCGTDVSIAYHEDSPLVFQSPITLGHEGAGTVDRLGDGVDGWAVGDRVIACPIQTCGRCPQCRGGATELMMSLGLPLERFGSRSPYRLSGGEQRRLSLACILARRPALLVLDEPTFGQDRRGYEALLGILRERVAAGTAVVAATHDERFVADFADRVVELAEGRVKP